MLLTTASVAVVCALNYSPGGVPTPQAMQEDAVRVQEDPGPFMLETMEKLTPDFGGTAPRVTFAVRNFDPETDAVFYADDLTLEEITMWQLQILDGGGRKIHYFQGQGRPASSTLAWHGLSADGRPFPGGFYNARFVWKDRAGRVHATAKASFNLFSHLPMPKFAKLKLEFALPTELI
ncbi:MAG: hypothetical protein COT18_03110 [Elusimicrobia bacterium CG08_land_8_20_14_0_20_59_10]|nr:MAG: hypothetical protein COT18_03110 [Elusimicrobia bacterium CG08_land_8_20_14_0_20_59_10]